jgi:hypothetical protein
VRECKAAGRISFVTINPKGVSPRVDSGGHWAFDFDPRQDSASSPASTPHTGSQYPMRWGIHPPAYRLQGPISQSTLARGCKRRIGFLLHVRTNPLMPVSLGCFAALRSARVLASQGVASAAIQAGARAKLGRAFRQSTPMSRTVHTCRYSYGVWYSLQRWCRSEALEARTGTEHPYPASTALQSVVFGTIRW